MSLAGFDPQILQDFLTESGELLERLEGDLVTLEHSPTDPELINQVFRALHTIKGSASFLALTNLVTIAHAAESALNAARNAVVSIDETMMNLLLCAVDTIKTHMAQLRSGQPLTSPDPAVVEALTQLGLGKTGQATAKPLHPATPPIERPPPEPADEVPIELGSGKADLFEYFLTDLDESLKKISVLVEQLADPDSRACTGAALAAASDEVVKSIEFFGLDNAQTLAELLATIGRNITRTPESLLPELVPRVRACTRLLEMQVEGLTRRVVKRCDLTLLHDRVEAILGSMPLSPEAALPRGASVDDVLRVDAVITPASLPSSPTKPTPHVHAEPADAAQPNSTPGVCSPPTQPLQILPDAKPPSSSHPAAPLEQTIRVDVARLEALMNLVGELVLQKNRISALARRVSQFPSVPGDYAESLTLSTSALDRVTGDIQNAVMRTRMQPLEKILGKYQRLIRDLAQKTKKKIDLVIHGADTELDKSVLEELGDPLVHLLRNAADHGIELPEERKTKGKPETGTIRIAASQEGNHVLVIVQDDGKGLQRARIASKAVEKGLITPDQAATLSDREIFACIFAAGFSTADQVSDLSGRGVGMDVVRTNIEKIKGSIELSSTEGAGCTIAIKIPLTVAIMPAMMVSVGPEIFAVPLDAILEIVRPEPDQLASIREHPVMRLRDAVLPLVSAKQLFGVPGEINEPFAVILEDHNTRVGMLVSNLIGQQEIVIKRLDGVAHVPTGPVSGATVRDDGGVSLIVDVPGVIRFAKSLGRRAAA